MVDAPDEQIVFGAMKFMFGSHDTSINLAHSINLLVKATRQHKSAMAAAMLAVQFHEGHGVPEDKVRAMKWANKSINDFKIEQLAETSHLAKFVLGRLLKAGYVGRSATQANRMHEAFKCFEIAVKNGIPYAHYSLGRAYLCKEGVPQDYDKAFQCFVRGASEIGCAYCINSLGSMYLYGIGTIPQNHAEGKKITQQGADKGNSYAQFNLAELANFFSEMSNIIPKRSLNCLHKAALQGHTEALYVLGNLYAGRSPGLEQIDIEKGVAFLTQCAAQGHLEALYELGIMYKFGNSVPKDARYGESLIARAAAQGHQSSLQFMQAHGSSGAT